MRATRANPLHSDWRSQFDRFGYVFLGRMLSDEQVEEARTHLTRMFMQLHPALRPDEIYSAHQQEPWLLDMATNTNLLDAVERVIGTNIVLWSTHLICKPPHTGRAIPWHQDGTYWNLTGPMVSVWLTFDDVDDENGTMYVLPGHHKRVFGRRATGDEFFDEEIKPDSLPEDIDDRAIAYRLRAGEAAMHHVLIPHRSPPNRSNDRWRRVLVLRYMTSDGEMGPKQYPDYRTNEPFDRQYILVRGTDDHSRGLVSLTDLRQSMRAARTPHTRASLP